MGAGVGEGCESEAEREGKQVQGASLSYPAGTQEAGQVDPRDRMETFIHELPSSRSKLTPGRGGGGPHPLNFQSHTCVCVQCHSPRHPTQCQGQKARNNWSGGIEVSAGDTCPELVAALRNGWRGRWAEKCEGGQKGVPVISIGVVAAIRVGEGETKSCL